MAERLRSIVREHEFEEQLERLIVNAEECDEFVNAAELILARDPLAGQPTRDPAIYGLPMAPVRGDSVVLYYSFDAEFVTFLAIVAF